MKGSRLFSRLHRLRITTKLLLAYLFLGMLPLLAFIGIYSYYLVQEQQKSMVYEKSTTLHQSVALLESRLQQTDMAHQILQSQVALLDLLNGSYRSASDELFAYNSQIEPSFTSILSDPAVVSVQVYRYYRSSLSYLQLVPYFEDMENFPAETGALQRLKTKNTAWHVELQGEAGPMLICCTNLYNQNYSRVIGVLEIKLRMDKIFENLDFAREGEVLYLRWQEQCYPLNASAGLLGEPVSLAALQDGGPGGALSASIPGTDMELIYFYVFEQTTFSSTVLYVVLSMAFLLFPSLLFWRYSNRFAVKLQNFSQHIRRSRKTSLAPYEFTGRSTDEFTIVVTEYNKLIASVEKLTQSVREAEKLKSEANFYALTSQIHPHFLFNTLENISMHIELEETEAAKNMLFILSRFLRYNISMQQESTLLEEVNHVRNYLLIHQYRQKKIVFQIDLPEEFQDVACPFCILQPIVENCLRHGQRGVGSQEISIAVLAEGERVLVEIADNGPGIPPDKMAELNRQMEQPEAESPDSSRPGGVGLRNVNGRLKYFYDPSCGLRFQPNEPSGTVCTLVMGKRPSAVWKGAEQNEHPGS